MARWSRGNTFAGLDMSPDAGSQFTSVRYGERLAEIGAAPRSGSIGDSFDNALAETVNGYYKSELIYGPARTSPWKTVEGRRTGHPELGALAQHGASARLSQRPTARRVQAIFYATKRTDQPLVEIQ